MAVEANTGTLSTEARTIRKLRIRIIPFIFLLFVVAFLDRVAFYPDHLSRRTNQTGR